MAWKQDLAKLKQQLGPEPPAPAPKPKAAPRPTGTGRIEDEDAVFLSAMGLNPVASRMAGPAPSQAPSDPAPTLEPPTPETFHEAVRDLKGLKPLAKGISDLPAPQPPVAVPDPPPVPEVPEATAAQEIQLPASPAPRPEPQPHQTAPLRIQLAAGMALEVDGTLDLRGHSLADAMDRLLDRLGDGTLLGWRILQVTLGPDPILHDGLIQLLATGQASMLSRYAQAPVPMGGTQAWLLYFGPPPAQP